MRSTLLFLFILVAACVGAQTYPPGTEVRLTAVADSGWSFSAWSGDASGTANPIEITVDVDMAVVATFTEDATTPPPPQDVTLTITIVGSGTVNVEIITPPSGPVAAFPGCEGFGCETPGGRGGVVVFVTNLNDSGPGSLRDALMMTVPRIVVFRVSGTIQLLSRIVLEQAQSFVTVAGETAPGDGIALAKGSGAIQHQPLLRLGSALSSADPTTIFHDGVFRHLRVRFGTNGGHSDNISVLGGTHNVVFSHCSFTWAGDEQIDITGAGVHDVTFEWNIIGEGHVRPQRASLFSGIGFAQSGHVTHTNISLHHNYIVHLENRNYKVDLGTYDFINNVNYNSFNFEYSFDQFYTSAQIPTASSFDVIGQYFKAGPDSRVRSPPRAWDILRQNPGTFLPMSIHLADIKYTDVNDVTLSTDAWAMVYARSLGGADPPTWTERATAHTVLPTFPVTVQSVDAGKDSVLASVGPRPLDAVDTRLIGDFSTAGGFSQTDVDNYPALNTTGVPTDTDGDGMPDAWETAHGLDPADPSDNVLDRNGDGYTNIEEWIHSLT